jgi:hypothetical protein
MPKCLATLWLRHSVTTCGFTFRARTRRVSQLTHPVVVFRRNINYLLIRRAGVVTLGVLPSFIRSPVLRGTKRSVSTQGGTA